MDTRHREAARSGRPRAGPCRAGRHPGGFSARFATASFPWDGSTANALLGAAESAPVAEPSPILTSDDAYEPPQADENTDPLTGALKAERVSLAMHKFVARCRREDRPVCLLYLDVGDLDGINQRMGTAAGDAVLKTAAGVLLRRLRESDLIGRLDGGSFLIAAACAPADAGKVAARIIDEIRETAVRVDAGTLHFTVNIGIAGFPDHGGTTRVLFDAAESALAAARRVGRNTFAVYTPGPARPSRFQEQRAKDRL